MSYSENANTHEVIQEARKDGLITPIPRLSFKGKFLEGYKFESEFGNVKWSLSKKDFDREHSSQIRIDIKSGHELSTKFKIDRQTQEVDLEVATLDDRGLELEGALLGFVWTPIYKETAVPQPQLLFLPYLVRSSSPDRHWAVDVDANKESIIHLPFAKARLAVAPEFAEMDIPVTAWPVEKLQGRVIREALFNSARLPVWFTDEIFWDKLAYEKSHILDQQTREAILAGIAETHIRSTQPQLRFRHPAS